MASEQFWTLKARVPLSFAGMWRTSSPALHSRVVSHQIPSSVRSYAELQRHLTCTATNLKRFDSSHVQNVSMLPQLCLHPPLPLSSLLPPFYLPPPWLVSCFPLCIPTLKPLKFIFIPWFFCRVEFLSCFLRLLRVLTTKKTSEQMLKWWGFILHRHSNWLGSVGKKCFSSS